MREASSLLWRDQSCSSSSIHKTKHLGGAMLDSRHWQILAVEVFLFYKVNLNWANMGKQQRPRRQEFTNIGGLCDTGRGDGRFSSNTFTLYVLCSWLILAGAPRRPRAFVIFLQVSRGVGCLTMTFSTLGEIWKMQDRFPKQTSQLNS